jgi:hypothetical protein
VDVLDFRHWLFFFSAGCGTTRMRLADFDESFLVAVGLTSLDPLLLFQAEALDQVLSWIEHTVSLLTAYETTLRFAVLAQGALFTKVMRAPAETNSTVKRYSR